MIHWQILEAIFESDLGAQVDVASKYPDEMVRWTIFRRRNGKFCPTARAVLKLICLYEKDNARFQDNLKANKWTKIWT